MLDRPLPSEVAAGRHRRWIAYRNFPAFSRPWLLRRSLIFWSAIAGVGALSWVGEVMPHGYSMEALLLALHFIAGAIVAVTTGPLLATLVRHRHWPARIERPLIISAIIVGLIVAYFADAWASGYILETSGQNAPSEDSVTSTTATLLGALLSFAIYFLVGGGLALRCYLTEAERFDEYRNRSEQLKALQREKLESDLRLGMLQAQVEPHFLFNTLSTLRSTIREDPAAAEATLDALSSYLRSIIPRLRHDAPAVVSTLGDQIDICDHYLEIMQLRMQDRMTYHIDVPQSLRELPFPPFILISLVENAIKHGIEPQRGAGRIEIQACRKNAELSVEVLDNGAGLQPDTGGGTGLSNIREQLQNRFGEDGALSLTTRPSGGVRASLKVPVEHNA